MDLLAWLVSQTATSCGVLTAGQDVPNETMPAEQTVIICRGRSRGRIVGREPLPWPAQASLDQRPAPPDPVAVAAIDQFICAARKATFRGVLAG